LLTYLLAKRPVGETANQQQQHAECGLDAWRPDRQLNIGLETMLVVKIPDYGESFMHVELGEHNRIPPIASLRSF
jgi:hypothetical protein